MSVASLIAKVGQSPNFIAFNAHWGFSFFAMTAAARAHVPLAIAGGACLAVAAVKEFWFDPRYETDQDVWPDGAEDFGGYAAGVLLAAALAAL
jgi:uncharacterized protein YfiM (DUF2279 family)